MQAVVIPNLVSFRILAKTMAGLRQNEFTQIGSNLKASSDSLQDLIENFEDVN